LDAVLLLIKIGLIAFLVFPQLKGTTIVWNNVVMNESLQKSIKGCLTGSFPIPFLGKKKDE